MITFLRLWENMQEDQPLMTSDASLAAQTVRAGLNLRGKDAGSTFWDDFLQMCNNSAGMGELLDVRPEQVGRWASRIGELVSRVNKEDDHQSAGQKNVLPTGDGTSPIANPF